MTLRTRPAAAIGLFLLGTQAMAADPGPGVEYVPAQFTTAISRLAVSPAEPAAHEPLELELFIGGNLVAPYVVDLHQNDDVITIRYRGDPAFAGPYGGEALTLSLPQGLAYGDYTLQAWRLGSSADEPLSHLEFTVAEPPMQVDTIGLYAAQTNHFFVTASFKEYLEISPYGWQRLGRDAEFKVWPADEPAPSTASPVCRFYSRLVNSHFYTGDESECESLKDQNSGWIYEGIAFQALIPKAGICPNRTRPIYRLYNGRAEEMDSNHRFITNPDMYLALVEDGWIGAGIAFCEAPTPPECGGFMDIPAECQAGISAHSREALTG